MRKLSKEEILEIAQKIFSGSDIIAKHGTSITNALSILETGFNYDKTSMVGQKSKDPVKLCSYGWKESKRVEASNVILSISKLFMKKLNGFSDEEYERWLENLNQKNVSSEMLFYGVSDKEEKEGVSYNGILLPGIEICHVPREFVKGCFVFCDNTNYMDFLSNQEEALEHLTYIENENYFDNLSVEEQDRFIEEYKSKREKGRSASR